jgi:hypothetical protein
MLVLKEKKYKVCIGTLVWTRQNIFFRADFDTTPLGFYISEQGFSADGIVTTVLLPLVVLV